MNPETWQQLKTLFHAALDLETGDRAAFLATIGDGDTEVRSQLERLLAAHDDAGHFLEAPALVDVGLISSDELARASEKANGVGQRIGPYEIVREIGRGGMGTVFLAVRADDQYRKQVAIKLINRGMDTDLILRRFMMERQILANLEHPNIARLLEGGSTDDGLPYFVMEYIEGQPITEYCDGHQLTNTKRLELFRSVCAALQYAHQNLVVHRDIKPGNILVTADGVTKLLDFGIAKLLSPGWAGDTGEATASVVRLMTPEYASPEQFQGLSITTATDVYSLGVVLYELLSGHHPYRLLSRQPAEVAEVILRADPEKPSAATGNLRSQPAGAKTSAKSVDRNPKALRGDLDNIVLKALRKEPARRYASAQEFSADIGRHLAGLPVLASPDTFSYRAKKFALRHKAGVLGATAVIITLVAATIVTTRQARVARYERAKAEQRFNDVRKLASSVVFELHDAIQNLAGSTPARELLVSRALEYLDKLAGEPGQDPSLKLELAAAYDKIGDIQGGFGTSHLGQRQKADESYRKALAIREALVAAAPDNVAFRRQLATSYTKLGEILWVAVDINGALELYGKALAVNKKLAAELPGDTEIRSELAISYRNFGYMHGANSRTEESLENLRKAVVLFEELAAADPKNAKLQYELALSYDKTAEIITGLTDQHAEALSLMRKAQDIGERLAAADPTNTKLRRGQAVGDFNVAQVSAKLGDTRTALDSSRKSLAIFTEMLAADPLNEDFRQAVAIMQTFVGEMMIKNGNASQAITLLTEALLTLEKSFAASPTDEIAHFRIAAVEAALGGGHVALASDDKAAASMRLAHWRQGRSWLQKSQSIYKLFLDAGKLTAEDIAKLDAISVSIAKCDSSIAELTGA